MKVKIDNGRLNACEFYDVAPITDALAVGKGTQIFTV